MTIEEIKRNAPEGATDYILSIKNDVHYLMNSDDCWYSWGFKTPNSLSRTQWNKQSDIAMDYFKSGIKPL